ncbi:MAG: hypothetical protein IJX92_03865 [Clostridia bacterium]|nr:hypothetical protein [Clostridia bacterium]
MKKKKILLWIIAVLSLVLALFSCTPSEEDKAPTYNDSDGVIYNPNTHVSLIIADENISSDCYTKIYNALFKHVGTGNIDIYINEIPEQTEHEIIIGPTDREISKEAYAILNRSEYDNLGDAGYVIYSDGTSLAIAYTDMLSYIYIEDELLAFADEYFTPELILDEGVVIQEKDNLIEIFRAQDEERQNEQWEAVAERAGESGEAIVAALKNMYTLYKPELVTWLANLYEERICVCTTYDQNGNKVCQHPTDSEGNPLCYYGGFYYSNSARNTEGYAPDIESTNQALSLLESGGLVSQFGGNWANAIPNWMKNELVGFVKGLQRSDGYFYHPQWSTEMHHNTPERMGRDLSWATSILKRLGKNPYYSTENGMKGEGKPVAYLSSRLGSLSSVAAVSKVIPASSGLNAHLKTPGAFRTYLAGLNIKTQSYGAGSALSAQTATIKSYDRQYAGVDKDAPFDYLTQGEYTKILFEWLDTNQNPENGLWDADSDYQACDGLFKIVCIYNDYKKPMKYAYQAAMATIAAISSDEPVYTVCNMYNAWHNIGLIRTNMGYALEKASSEAEKEKIRAEIAQINDAIFKKAPEAISSTIKKTENFAIPDGSFSYLIGHSSDTSTGMPTAVLNSYEGDVNATLICIGGLLGNMYTALNLPFVRPYGLADWYIFLDIVESNNSSLKDGSMADTPLKFEDDNVDERPENVKIGIESEKGKMLVANDPVRRDNQVLQIWHPAQSYTYDYARFTNFYYSMNRNCSIFESDFYIASEGTDNTYVTQMLLNPGYAFSFRIKDGMVEIWEDSSLELVKTKARLLAKNPLDDWFNLRIEYYKGTHETVRIKFYLDDELIAVSANYFNSSGKKLSTGTGTPGKGFEYLQISPLSYVNLNMYMDNTLVTGKNVEYKSEANTKGLIINEDIPDSERKTYDFTDGTLSGDINIVSGGGNVSVSEGTLKFSNNSQKTVLTIPAFARQSLANCYALGFDIDFTDAAVGDVMTFEFTKRFRYTNEDKITGITSLTLKCVTEDGQKYLVVTSKNGALTYSATKIAVSDEPTKVEFVHFSAQMHTLIYINGELAALCDYIADKSTYRFELGDITLTYSGKMEGTLDNVFVEARRGDYTTETTPKVDRDIYDFEDGLENLQFNGKIDEGLIYLMGGQYLTVPLNKRVNNVFSYELYLDLYLDKADEEAFTRVCFLDKNGNIIFALDFGYDGKTLSLYEVTESGRLSIAIVSIVTEAYLPLTLNYYPENDIVAIKNAGTYLLSTGIFYNDERGEVASAKIISDGASVDNVYLEGLLFTYSPPTYKSETKDDTDEVITYEYSSTGDFPNRVTATLKTGGAKAAIELMTRKNEVTKVLNFTTSAGDADYIDFVTPASEKYTSIVFESDIYFGINGYYEINVLNSTDGSKNAYRPVLSGRNGKLYCYDTASNGGANPGPEKAIADLNTWVRFKMIVDLGTCGAESANAQIYINDNLVYDSQNFVVKNGSLSIDSLNRVRFYTHSSSTGSLYFDNTSMKEGPCLHGALTEGDIITPPTCYSEGERELVCHNPDCDYKTAVSLPVTDHDLVDGDVITPPTCTAEGEKKIFCQNSGCSYETTDTIPVDGHSLGEWMTDESDSTHEKRKCANCDYYETRLVEVDDYIDNSSWVPIG